MNSISQTMTEFDKRYKYCFDSLEGYYIDCSTCDVKSDEDVRNEWLERAELIDKIIRELNLCKIDARYLADCFKNKKNV